MLFQLLKIAHENDQKILLQIINNTPRGFGNASAPAAGATPCKYDKVVLPYSTRDYLNEKKVSVFHCFSAFFSIALFVWNMISVFGVS